MKSTNRKWIWYVLAAIYILSPIDLIPDALLGIGQVDDVVALLALLAKISADMGITDAVRKKLTGSPSSSKNGHTHASKKVFEAEIVK